MMTGKSPVDMLMNRRLKTILDRLHPDLTESMRKGADENSSEGAQPKSRMFRTEDPVFICSYSSGPSWILATVVEMTGPVSYKTRTQEGIIMRRSVDTVCRSGALRVATDSISHGERQAARPEPPGHPDTGSAVQTLVMGPVQDVDVARQKRSDGARALRERVHLGGRSVVY